MLHWFYLDLYQFYVWCMDWGQFNETHNYHLKATVAQYVEYLIVQIPL